jgi:hypothetical protein
MAYGGPTYAASPQVELPVSGVAQLLLDEPNERLYLSTGVNDDAVVVMDLDGTVTHIIDELSGPHGMSLSPDGKLLWVTLQSADVLVAFETGGFTEVDRIDLPSGYCPAAVAAVGSRLVVGTGCSGGELLLIDLDGDRVPRSTGPNLSPNYRVLLDVVPGRDDIVVAGEAGLSPGEVFVIDITGEEPSVLRSVRHGANLRDVAAAPNGMTFLTAAGSPYQHDTFSIDTLDIVHTYPTQPYPAAAAWTADGSHVALGTDSPYDDDIHVFATGTTTPSFTAELNGTDGKTQRIVSGALAVDAAADHVYAVSYAAYDGTIRYHLHIVDVGAAPGEPPAPAGGLGAIEGVIRHGFPNFNAGTAPQGHVDLYDADETYLGTYDAISYGSYRINDLEPGTYYLVFWNGDDDTILDFFPELYSGKPLLHPGKGTPVEVRAGVVTQGINADLRPLYFDMFDSVFLFDIYWLGNTGITRGCNPPENTLFCVGRVVTRGEMAAFLRRALLLPDGGGIEFIDDDASIFENDIERVAAAAITTGCNPPLNTKFCPDEPVTRAQAAAFLVRAFGFGPSGAVAFVDDDGSLFEQDITALAAAGITQGCNPPVNDRFCPKAPLTRGQMAAMLHRAFTGGASASPATGDVVSGRIVRTVGAG